MVATLLRAGRRLQNAGDPFSRPGRGQMMNKTTGNRAADGLAVIGLPRWLAPEGNRLLAMPLAKVSEVSHTRAG
ncbi:hypothetical protein [Chitinilyticum litopenaei]|uniref:hypothetical protein n=1 Tax=Chitinilyticum litopenaei TaxID=1121276 RepID=UPI00048FB95A|nr:hypothetical protein [Chitinilyticum litopenaei]